MKLIKLSGKVEFYHTSILFVPNVIRPIRSFNKSVRRYAGHNKIYLSNIETFVSMESRLRGGKKSTKTLMKKACWQISNQRNFYGILVLRKGKTGKLPNAIYQSGIKSKQLRYQRVVKVLRIKNKLSFQTLRC